MKQLLVLALMLPTICLAKTEAECAKSVDKLMPAEYRGMEFAKYIMICNVKLMEGFRIYLDGGKYIDKKIRQMYPCKDDEGNECAVTAIEKADRLIEYEQCVEITNTLQNYMKKCQSNKE